MNKRIDDAETLESLVDSYGVASIASAIADICHQKAEDIRHDWQDKTLATVWDRLGRAISPRNVVLNLSRMTGHTKHDSL